MLDDMIKFNGLTLSNYVLQSHATDNVGTLIFPSTPKANSMHILVQVLHLDRGMVNSWPQALIAVVVLLLEEVKVADINKIKDKLRNYLYDHTPIALPNSIAILRHNVIQCTTYFCTSKSVR
jgi:hypothetical protein